MVAMQRSKQTSYVVRCFAAIAIGAALFALWTRTTVRPDSLSPAESAIVGTWTYSDETGVVSSITFDSDRTCVFPGSPSKSRWRSDGAAMFVQHKYKTVVGPTPMPLPSAVTNFELPSFMATKESFVRPVSLSDDRCSMTLGAITGIAPAFTLTRAPANASSASESESGITK